MSKRDKDRVCPPSVVKWLNNPLRKLIQNPSKIFKDYVQPGSIAIDLGCGGGFFTVELARMVGERGRVFAVDLQEEMLQITRRLAECKGVMDRITLHRCQKDAIGLTDVSADFLLAFYMVHEVPEHKKFLTEAAALLNPDGRFMLIEPKHHVNQERFDSMIKDAESVGLYVVKPVKLFWSRGAVLAIKRDD